MDVKNTEILKKKLDPTFLHHKHYCPGNQLFCGSPEKYQRHKLYKKTWVQTHYFSIVDVTVSAAHQG
jgi:hypothetical protein